MITNRGNLECGGKNDFGILDPIDLTDLRAPYLFHTLSGVNSSVREDGAINYGTNLKIDPDLLHPADDHLRRLNLSSAATEAISSTMMVLFGLMVTRWMV